MVRQIAKRGVTALLTALLGNLGLAAPAIAQFYTIPVAPIVSEPFGGNLVPVSDGEVVSKWSGVVADIRAESDTLTRCREAAGTCPAAAQKFLAVIAEGRTREGRARFGVINRAINLAIQPVSDLAQWGVPDRWSAPLETFTTGKGDCEDYAIAKYVALREAGIAEDDLRLVIVRDLTSGEDHAIVAARLDAAWIVLDNRRFVLLEDIQMRGVVPLLMLDHDGVKWFAPTAIADAGSTVAPAATAAAPAALGL